MAYRCVHCSEIYKDASQEVLDGCSKCHSRFFFYIKDEKLKQILEQKELEPELSRAEKERMEEDVREIVGLEEDDETPVFLDFESIKVVKPGKYLLDLQKLFSKEKPRVYQIENGRYIVDLMSISTTDNAKEQ